MTGLHPSELLHEGTYAYTKDVDLNDLHGAGIAQRRVVLFEDSRQHWVGLRESASNLSLRDWINFPQYALNKGIEEGSIPASSNVSAYQVLSDLVLVSGH